MRNPLGYKNIITLQKKKIKNNYKDMLPFNTKS